MGNNRGWPRGNTDSKAPSVGIRIQGGTVGIKKQSFGASFMLMKENQYGAGIEIVLQPPAMENERKGGYSINLLVGGIRVISRKFLRSNPKEATLLHSFAAKTT